MLTIVCRAGAVPLITFLLGGQDVELATNRLNAIHVRYKAQLLWPLMFSFARHPALVYRDICSAAASNFQRLM